MTRIVELIDEVLSNHDNETRIKDVKKQVNGWMKDYPLFSETFEVAG
jgi:glycine hydroxymethyltransferase